MSENMQGTCSNCGQGSCRCMHHKIIPLAIIVIGALFLSQAIGSLDAAHVNMWWPICLIIIGVVKLGGRNCKCCGPNKS